MNTVLNLKNVGYRYEGAKSTVLANINASFETGKVYVIIGRSGAGKSTLLSLISGLDTASEGEILYQEKNLKKIDRDKYRARSIGVVFQGFNLLSNATAVQNIVLSMNISKSPEKHKKEYAYNLLESVGIDRESANRKVLKLSGGEQQRVGIARALAHSPAILIADEPTGNLDKETENEILKIFTRLAKEENRCVILVTHSKKVSEIADTIYGIEEGRLKEIDKANDDYAK